MPNKELVVRLDVKNLNEIKEIIARLNAEVKVANAVCQKLSDWAGPTMATLHPDLAQLLGEWRTLKGGE